MSRRRSMQSSSFPPKKPSAPSSLISPLTVKSPSKMRNVKCEADGLRFDSKKELARYQDLKILLRAGEIRDLQVHPHFDLVVDGYKVCRYEADFAYFPTDAKGVHQRVVEDVKGVRKGGAWEKFRIKVKLFRALYGFDVTVV